MKAVILVAGYNTRLLSLTGNVPKALLKVGEKAIVQRIIEKIELVNMISDIFLVSNSKYFHQFESWLTSYKDISSKSDSISLIDDGTCTNETRRGAIGDLAFVLQNKNIDDDILLVACDNIFEIDLNVLCALSCQKHASVVATYRFENVEDVRNKFGVITVNKDNQVVGFQEKPDQPSSTIAATAIYVIKKEHLKYIMDLHGRKTDKEKNLGELIMELVRHGENVYCHFIPFWFDIGTPDDLIKAEAFFKK